MSRRSVPLLNKARYVDGYRIELSYDDGTEGIVDLEDQLWGETFEPLKKLRTSSAGGRRTGRREVLLPPLRARGRIGSEPPSEPLASLDGPPDPGAESAWEEEIRRRVAAIEAGTVKLEPWEAVKSRIEKVLRKR